MRNVYATMRSSTPQQEKPGGLASFKETVSRRLEDFGGTNGGSSKTVNVLDLFDNGTAPNSAGENVGFNRFKPGSQEWFKYGQETGVWVDGASAQIFLSNMNIRQMNNKEARFENAMRFLHQLGTMLQRFQDAMVEMSSAGIEPSQMKKFARDVFATDAELSFEKLRNKPDQHSEAAMHGIAGIMMMLKTHSARDIERNFLNKMGEVDGERSVVGEYHLLSLDSGFERMLTKARTDNGIELPDSSERDRRLESDRLRIVSEMSKEIRKLPLDQQDEAWALLDESLEQGRIDAANATQTYSPELTQHDLVVPAIRKNRSLIEGVGLGAGVAVGALAVGAGAMYAAAAGAGTGGALEALSEGLDTDLQKRLEKSFEEYWYA